MGAIGAVEGCTSNKPTHHNPTPSRTPTPGASTSASVVAPTPPTGSVPAVITSAEASQPVASSSTLADLDALAKALGDRLVRPGDPRYLNAAHVYSTRFDSARPVAVARCSSVDDVQQCLDFVRSTGTKVAARGGGHSYAGYSTTSGLVIDVGPMNNVATVDATTARVGAGATLIDVYSGLATAKRAVPGGSCPSVGIAGSTLGGGVGVVARKYGLTCDALTAVDVVTPDGKLLHCSENEEPDLFWAHRGGGGGNFGIVTALEFRTHETPNLTRFVARWNWSNAHNVVTAWQQWLPTTDDALWASLHLDGAGSSSDQPHVYVSGVYVGTPAGLAPLLDALQSAAKAPMTERYVKEDTHLQTMFVEGGCATLTPAACHRADTTPGGKLGRESNAARSDFIASPLSGAGVDALLTGIEARRTLGLPGGSVLFDAYGGAINTIAPADTAFVNRDKLACLQYVAPWGPGSSAATIAANQGWLDNLYAAMRPFVSGFAYVNYIDAKLPDWQRAYYGANLDRLIRIKAATDPKGLLAFAQGIPTA